LGDVNPPADPHQRLLALLDEGGATYRVIEHELEGRSEEISRIRGNDPAQAMKAIVLSVKGGGGGKRNVMAVIPGNRRLNMKALLQHMGAQKGRFAPPEEATELTGCVMGAIPPFSFRDDLAIVVDERFQAWDEVAFNAGRLDRSLFLNFADYRRIVEPTFADLSEGG
jgi:Ala-tRNA(Pro) deacylase